MPSDNRLSVEDIQLLMGNYQNIIKINTILLEQQKQLYTLCQQLIENQKDLSTDQRDLYNEIQQALKQLEVSQTHISNLNQTVKDINQSNDLNFSEARTSFDDFKDKVDAKHNSIIKNIYISMVGMGSIILGLISIIVTLIQKKDIIEKIYEIVMEILKHVS